MFEVTLFFTFGITCAFWQPPDVPACQETSWEILKWEEGEWVDYATITSVFEEVIPDYYGEGGELISGVVSRGTPSLVTYLPAGEHWFKGVARPNGSPMPVVYVALPPTPSPPAYLNVGLP